MQVWLLIYLIQRVCLPDGGVDSAMFIHPMNVGMQWLSSPMMTAELATPHKA